MQTDKHSLIRQLEEGKRDTLPLTGEEMAELYLSLKAELEAERAKKPNLTMQVAQNKWRAAEAENRKLRMHYAGVIGLLSKVSDLLYEAYEADESNFEPIERAIKDWCEFSGWTYQVNSYGAIQLIEPESEDV